MYISQEDQSGGTSSTLTLDNEFEAGSVLITFNNKLTYRWREVSGGANDDDIELDFAPLASDSILVSYYVKGEPNILNATRYLTVRQVKDTNSGSRVTALTSDTDDNVEQQIREVEAYIDAYCGYWDKYYQIVDDYESQQLTFPRTHDYEKHYDSTVHDYVGIPKAITRAALYALENIYLSGAPSTGSAEMYQSEHYLDYSYSKKQNTSLSDAFKDILGMRAIVELKGYRKRVGKINIDNKDSETNLNSRQRFLIE